MRLGLHNKLAVLATASNGFRAPSLHQVWFNSVSTQFVADEEAGELVPTRSTFPRDSIAAFREANGRTPNDFEREVIRSTLLNREEQNRFEDAVPRSKFNLFVRYNLKRVGILVAATYYGSVEYKPTNEEQGETFGGKILIDLDIACEVVPGVRLSVGNLLNTFPNEHRKEANIGSRGFLYSRRVTQFGTNGGFYYGRIGLDL